MAIQYINTGSSANAGDGDSLRSAFIKVNNNFAYLSTSTGVGGNGYTGSEGPIGSQGPIGFTGSEGSAGFTGSEGSVGFTGSQGDIGPIGFTGSAATNDFGSQGQLGFYRNTGTIVSPVPGISYTTATATLSIGNSTNRSTSVLWTRETYSPTARGWTFAQHYDNSDVLDFTWYRTRGTALSPTILNTNDDIADFAFTTWNGTQTSESAAMSVRVENTSTLNPNPAGKFMFFTNDGSRRFPVLVSELSSTGTFKFFKIGALEGGNSLTVESSLIPAVDVAYDLGSTSSQWRSLYVSSSTIYINRKALSIDENNNITINGEIATGGYTGSQGDRGFTGSRGNAGSTGEAGATGFTGSRGNLGFTGSRGDTGYDGSQGDIGYAGSRGNLGFTGSRGDTGYDGSQGDIGYTGSEGTPGQQGNRGYTGSEGAQGTPGLQGLTGAQGVSIVLVGSTDTVTTSTVGLGNAGQGWINTTDGDVYFWNTLTTNWENIGPIVGPQGDLGYTGSQGSQGNIGLTGDLGYTGSQGDRGYDGSRGDVGYAGSQGELGYVGSQGDIGYVGSQGDVGYTGSQGELGYVGSQGDIGYVGSAGADGADALWNWQGEYDAGPMYQEGDIVSYQGSTYRRNAVGNSVVGEPPTNATYWEVVAERAQEDRLVNGSWAVVLGANGTLTLADDIILPQAGRLIKDCGNSGSTTAMRWVNIPTDQEVQLIRAYTGDPAIPGPGDLERGTISVEWQSTTTSGVSITAFDRTDGADEYKWNFKGDGDLKFPGTLDYRIGESFGGGSLAITSEGAVNIFTNSVEGFKLWSFGADGNLQLPEGGEIRFSYGYIDQDTDVNDNALRISGGNGVVIKADEDGKTWLFDNAGTLTAPGHLLPNADLAYDLGSTSSQWRSIYVGTGTIYIGGIELGVNRSEQVTVNGNPIITVNTAGNMTLQGDTIVGTVIVSNTAPNPDTMSEGAQWFNTEEARTYLMYNGQWVDASPTVLAPPDTNPTLESVTFNDATVQTTAWTGTYSYDDLTDKPVAPTFVGGGGASTWLTAD